MYRATYHTTHMLMDELVKKEAHRLHQRRGWWLRVLGVLSVVEAGVILMLLSR